MPVFEFVIQGPPGATVNTKENNAARYRKWVKTVAAAAQREWPVGQPLLLSSQIIVSVSNYYRTPPDRPEPPDVDNLLKPILDGLIGVVYEDDRQVFRVISDRYAADGVTDIEPLVASLLPLLKELVYIRLEWPEE